MVLNSFARVGAGAAMLFTTPALAQQQNNEPLRIQNWSADAGADYVEAWTGNESGSTFGVLCGQTCIVYVDFQTECDHGEPYPAMVNSPSGAFNLQLTCHRFNQRYILSTPLSDGFSGTIRGGGEIGFAIPLRSGRFNVARFSLSGALEAVGAAVQISTRMRNENQRGLRDFTI